MRCLVIAACYPVRGGVLSRSRAGLWLLPTCRRWTGCPDVSAGSRARSSRCCDLVELSRCFFHADGAAGASRTAFALHVGQPVKRARGFPARATHGGCILISPRLGGDRSGRRFSPLACGSGRLAALQFGPLALRRTPHRARNRVDAIFHDPSYHRAKARAERQRASHCWAACHHDE